MEAGGNPECGTPYSHPAQVLSSGTGLWGVLYIKEAQETQKQSYGYYKC